MIDFLLPDAISSGPAIFLIVASFFTSGITAVVGMGGGFGMLALMTYFIPIVALIPVHGLVQLGSNAGRAIVQRNNIEWRVGFLFMGGAIFGAIIGTSIAVQMPEKVLLTIVGFFILIMAVAKIPAINALGSSAVFVGGGLITFLSMFVGATGPLTAAFLKNYFDTHRQVLATQGLCLSFQHTAKVIAFVIFGFSFWEWLPFALAMIASGYAGTIVGTRILDRTSDNRLKLIMTVVLVVIALDMIRRGLELF